MHANRTAFKAADATWRSAISDGYANDGKIYFEVKIDIRNSHIKIGVCNDDDLTASKGDFAGADGNSWGFDHQYYKWHDGGSAQIDTDTYDTGDVVGVALDIDAGKIWFAVNNVWAEGDPAAGTGESFDSIDGTNFHAIGTHYNSAGTGQFTLRLHSSRWDYSPPSGFSAMPCAKVTTTTTTTTTTAPP